MCKSMGSKHQADDTQKSIRDASCINHLYIYRSESPTLGPPKSFVRPAYIRFFNSESLFGSTFYFNQLFRSMKKKRRIKDSRGIDFELSFFGTQKYVLIKIPITQTSCLLERSYCILQNVHN